jgi:methyl-accepting chemotaxis protein
MWAFSFAGKVFPICHGKTGGDAQMTALHIIQNQIFMGVGPSRIAVLSLVAATQQDVQEHETLPHVIEQSVERVKTAYFMLSGEAEVLAEANQFYFSSDLKAQGRNALVALQPFYDLVIKKGFHPAKYRDELIALRGTAMFCVEKKVSSFLCDMVEAFGREERLREIQHNTEMSRMVEDVDALGRNIQLIAFNASVEAARVGDMGKGFSVVAAEIRELSQKMQGTLKGLSERLSG